MNQPPSFDDKLDRLAAADPVDDRELATRVALLAGDVIAEIAAGAGAADTLVGRRQGSDVVGSVHRRRPWSLIAVAAAAAVVVVVALVGLVPGTSSPAYAITVDRGVVVVNWMRDLRDGSTIGKDLRGYGIDATVRAVPASPSLVGRVLTVAVNGVDTGEMPPGVSWGADGTDDVFTWRIDPSVFKESIQIALGVETEPGKPYVTAESAFAPGEVLGGLQCAVPEPITSAAVDEQLRRLGVDVRWFRVVAAAESAGGDRSEEVPSATAPAGTVINAQPINDRSVRVTVAPPGASLASPMFEPVRPAAECTPELASRWVGVL